MTQHETTYLANYQPPAFLIDSVNLCFHLDPTATQVINTMQVRRSGTAGSDSTLALNGFNLKLKQVTINERTLTENDYEVSEDGLLLPNFPESATLTIITEIDPQNNTALEGLYMSNGRFFTQCEAQGFRRITYYQDRPDVLAKFTTTVHGDKKTYPYCLSNGNLIEQGENADTGAHWFTWENPHPMPSYLFALVAGQFAEKADEFTTMSGRQIQLRIFVEPRNENKCAHALFALKAAMTWDEQAYGREYDLDNYMICAVDDFNSGAMENKGLNIFNSECVLANEETSTDFDFELIEAVVGHEYFHNWTGNRVTCRDWFQLCLKEGLTVFREQQFMATMALPVQQRIADVRLLRTRQFAEDASPMAHPVRPEKYQQIRNFYTATVYNKGAEIYRMLWHLLGAENFRKGMDRYFEKYDGSAATIDIFVENMTAATGKDLSQFHHWYHQAGTPEVTVKTVYDQEQQTLTLQISQHTPPTPNQTDKQPVQFPFVIGLIDKEGRDLPLNCVHGDSPRANEGVLEITAPQQSFVFGNLKAKPMLSLLRGFSAPVKVFHARTLEELLFLWQHDSDDFNRWDAGQQYLSQILFDAIDSPDVNVIPPECIAFIKSLLSDTALNPAFVAELITLPSELYLAEQMTPVDIDGIVRVLAVAKKEIATQCAAELQQCYARCQFSTVEPKKQARQCQNLCLDYLSTLAADADIQRCVAQYDAAVNLTDRLAALRCLTHLDCGERVDKLAEFYQMYHQDPIVVNKWLNLQAQSSLPNTIAEIKRLMKHDSFSLKNPNKVRALIGSLCMRNPKHFHAISGEGYALLADVVLALDPMNPQMAARIVSPLIHGARFDPARRELMKAQCLRIQQQPTLSDDVNEIISKVV